MKITLPISSYPSNITLPSYPKVWNLGHPHIENLFDGPVVVQEKVDGSHAIILWGKEDKNHQARPEISSWSWRALCCIHALNKNGVVITVSETWVQVLTFASSQLYRTKGWNAT